MPRPLRRKTRLALLALSALALAPGTWLRSAPPAADLRPILRLDPVAFHTQPGGGAVSLEGVWHLSSPNSHFGSYSALAAMADGSLLAVSDKGRWLRFTPPGRPPTIPRFGAVGGAAVPDKRQVDAEALVLSPDGALAWIAYEGSNSIARYRPDLSAPISTRPPEMARWPANKGPEAMTRLADGRFIVLGEGSPDWLGEGFPALLFNGNPVDGAAATRFGFTAPEGYRATDMAALPDGRVLVLLRAIESVIPPRFSARLLVADPADIRAEAAWTGETIAAFDLSLPTDNFEGLAIEPRADGSLTLWLISDDNGAKLQRTLLYRLHWTPDARKARPASPARLSVR